MKLRKSQYTICKKCGHKENISDVRQVMLFSRVFFVALSSITAAAASVAVSVLQTPTFVTFLVVAFLVFIVFKPVYNAVASCIYLKFRSQ